jgi:hypothetical protein
MALIHNQLGTVSNCHALSDSACISAVIALVGHHRELQGRDLQVQRLLSLSCGFTVLLL